MTVPRTMAAAGALFAIGAAAVIAIFVLGALDRQASWLWAVSMAAPIGMGVALVHAVRPSRKR